MLSGSFKASLCKLTKHNIGPIKFCPRSSDQNMSNEDGSITLRLSIGMRPQYSKIGLANLSAHIFNGVRSIKKGLARRSYRAGTEWPEVCEILYQGVHAGCRAIAQLLRGRMERYCRKENIGSADGLVTFSDSWGYERGVVRAKYDGIREKLQDHTRGQEYFGEDAVLEDAMHSITR